MIEKYDNLTITRNNNFYLDSTDYHILETLYKPLIGPGAINYYLSLYEASCFKNPNTIDKVFVMDLISDNYLKEEVIDKFIGYLEDVKLLRFKDGSFELYPNYSAKEYFMLPFSMVLKANVSKTHFKQIKNRFNIDYEIQDTSELRLPIVLKDVSYKKGIENKNFDFLDFKNNILDIDKELLDDDQEFFMGVSKTFNFSTLDLISIMYEIDNNDGTYDKKSFLEKAYQKYTLKQEREERAKKKESSDDDKFLYFKENSAETILNYGKKMVSMSRADQDILKRMREELKLSEELISLLVSYSLATNERKLYPYNYFEKVALDWKNKDIKSVEDAYFYINELFVEKKPKIKKEESVEDWFKEFIEKAKKEKNTND